MSVALFARELRGSLPALLVITVVLALYIVSIAYMFDPEVADNLDAVMAAMPDLFAAFGMANMSTNMTDFMLNYLYGFLFTWVPLLLIMMMVNRMLVRPIDRGSMACLVATPASRLRIAARFAACMGAVLVFDTGWLDDLSIENYREYIELADYYTPNQKEALKITGADTPARAAEILSDYFENVIVKLDKDGCLIRENGREHVIPNIPEFAHQDSTGAGDAFLAGLLYGLYHDSSFRESVLFGNITGGKCVTAVGCLTAYCTEPELLTLAKKYRGFLA